jgi:hypothetical protein
MKESVQAVVIFIRNGIELVIMAASTIDRQTQERSAQVVDRVLNCEMLRIVRNPRAKAASVGEVTCGDDFLVTILGRLTGQQVTG